MIRVTTMLSRTMLRNLAGENLEENVILNCENRDSTVQFLCAPLNLIGHGYCYRAYELGSSKPEFFWSGNRLDLLIVTPTLHAINCPYRRKEASPN